MSQYLILKDVEKDSVVFAMSRNNMMVEYIVDNIPIPYDKYVRIEDVEPAIYEINKSIRYNEQMIDTMLIQRSFDIHEYIEAKEYLVELYETRGRLYTINGILSENKNIQMIYS